MNRLAGTVWSIVGGDPKWKFELDPGGGDLTLFWIDLNKKPNGDKMKKKIEAANGTEKVVVVVWEPGGVPPHEVIRIQ
jgi:hypothetical protein